MSLKIAKTKKRLKNILFLVLMVKRRVTSSTPKTRLFRCDLIRGYIQFQNGFN